MTQAVEQVVAAGADTACEPVDPLTLLVQLLLVPSPTGAAGAAAAVLVDLTRAAGFASHVDAAGNVVMSWGDGARANPAVRYRAGDGDDLLLLGHLDTVPGRIPVRVEGGRLFGRGAVDAKGPLAAAIAAVARQPRCGRPITVVAARDEEGASLGARHLRETWAPPRQLIVLEPSGWDTVTTAYRGCIRLRARIERDAAHHAGPEPGGADSLVRLLAGLQHRCEALHVGGSAARTVDRVQLRVNALATSATSSTETAEVELELRVPATTTVAGVLDVVREELDQAVIELQSTCEPVVVPRGNAVARALARAIAAQGARPRYTSKTGTSDLNVVWPAWRCEAAVYGPGDCLLDHTPRESVDIGELRRGASVLAAAIRGLR